MADDENILLLLSMGFPDIEEIKKALRIAKNDITEAVAILTNEQPVNMDDLSLDIDMRDLSNDYGVAGSNANQRGNANENNDLAGEDGKLEFPSNHLYELEQRVFQENWNIPYRKEESFGRCLSAALRLARENLVETDENCKKFVERIMPEGFKKLLTTNAVQRWQGEVHDGILSLLELYLELIVARMQFEPVPNGMLKVLSWAFDITSSWNLKNVDQSSQGRWTDNSRRGPFREYARPTKSSGVFPRDQNQWLCDLINFFGDLNGFETILTCFKRADISVHSMSLILQPFSNCVELLVKSNVSSFLLPCMQKAYGYLDKIEECELKTKEISAVTDLIQSLKSLSFYLSPDDIGNYDRLRLRTICRMLQAPQFNSKMNALKEVSKLIDESKQSNNSNEMRFNENFYISENEIVEWMSENKVLTIALEGNIDQVQYADRLKSMVDFLGPMLSIDELTKMWNLQDSPVPHVMDNVHAIMSSAAARFSQTQFDHLTGLINARWAKSNDRIREQLLIFIGQIGRDVQHVKQTQSILQLLWDVSHLQSMPKHLVEKALSEQLAILTEMTMNKDPNRRVYIQKCIDDIRMGKENVVPAVNHLHKICKSYSKGTVIYSKSDKAILSELNDQHSIIQLLCDSVKRSLKSAEDLARIHRKQKEDVLLHGRFLYREYVEGHLDILKFFLKEGDLYLPWRNCEELWEVLCTNPKSNIYDRDLCFAWFESCLSDLEPSTQTNFFNRFLKDVSPSDLTMKGFDCYKAFFESLNYNKQYLRKTAGSCLVVENLDLIGKDFLWETITDCTRENIAYLAINYFLNMAYVWVSPKIKKESIILHQSFIGSCYKKLEKFENENPKDFFNRQEGFEIEMSVGGERIDSFPKTNSTDLSSSVFQENGQEDETKLQMLRISRLLLLAERYVSTIEASYSCQRNLPPHAETFRGRPLKVKVIYENRKEESEFESHTNELVCDLKSRVGDWLKLQVDQFSIQVDNVNIGHEKDRFLVGFIGSNEGQTWVVKSTGTGTTASSSSMPLVEIYDETSKDSRTEASTSKNEISSVPNEQEKLLPGVVMATGGKIFAMLYKLSNLKDNRVLHGIRRLIHLIPTDPNVVDVLDSISYHSNAQPPVASADASPKLSPRKTCVGLKNSGDVKAQLAELYNSSGKGMSAFRVLYNLEVLSARLMPTKYDPITKFSNDFLEADGLTVILNIFHHDALPHDVDADIRQSIYLVVLQLTRYLLCGEGILHTTFPLPQSPLPRPNPLTSPLLKPTPPKKSALDSSIISSIGKSPLMVSSSRVVQTMSEIEFTDVLSCLMRIVWAAAAGNLQLAASGLPSQVEGEQQNNYRYYVCRRSSQSSTGSSGSTGSDNMTGASPSGANETLYPGVCIQQTHVQPGDSQIASEALQLLVTCLQLRSNNISIFYTLPMVSDFIVDTVLGSPSESVRKRAVTEFQRLAKIRLVSRSLEFGDSNLDSKGSKLTTPRQFLTKIILKTPVPLWMPSCKSRGISHSILAQCMEYFDLRCFLLGELTKKDQEILCISSSQMLDDELNFLHNYTRCQSPVDCTLIAGHLKLAKALLLCEGNNKRGIGESFIGEILYVYLFPSSRLIADGVLNNSTHEYIMETRNINPKCDTSESRVAAYDLLVELARQSAKNMKKVVDELIRMHHSYNESLSKEFEYEPPIDRRAECNYVGLKNAGATCYMNSVLQQLYNVPNIRELLLGIELENEDEDTIFYQLQNVFGHLYESKLQHYVPEKFWKCFKLHGVQVNVREQQDAFEFFTQIVDQIDEYLISQKKPKLFARHFEGMWSEVKICQECPHRTKKEQAFMALNLTVRSNNLLDSLQQFVNGELLEGQNAYFCEKCQEKRTAMARTHLKKLPQTLVIQLNRFHYDWETSRSVKFDDYFEFPWMLDMAPYTADGVRRAEQSEQIKKHDGEMSMDAPETPSSNRKVSFSSMFSRGDGDFAQPYELVGVVVHSGQASAGHYYSFIKERQSNCIGGRVKDRWLKFNDTTVEEFDMTEEKMRTECFGGTYKVKKTGMGSSMPEERTRYWNAYMLFYESKVERKPSRTTRRSFSHSQQFQRGGSSAQRKISMPAGPTSLTESLAPKESLSELTDLVEKSEKKSLFSSRMPAAIERGIQEENLRFLQSRDVFCNDYYDFIFNLVNVNRTNNVQSKALFDSPMQTSCNEKHKMNTSVTATESIRLAVHFLLNSFFHIRRRNEDLQQKFLNHIENIMERYKDANEWILHFISSNSSNYIRTILLDCNAREVRASFATLIERSVYFYLKFNDNTEAEDIKQIMLTLVNSIEKDVSNCIRSSSQLFWILAKFSKMGVSQCVQLFELNAFRNMIKLLLGVEPDPDDDDDLQSRSRRWSISQSRELGELHSAIAYLILACETTPHRTCAPPKAEKMCEGLPLKGVFHSDSLYPMPLTVSSMLYGRVAKLYIREAVCACREVSVPIGPVVDALVQVSFCCSFFSKILVEEIMKQYNNAPSGELKNLSTLLVEILVLADPLQADRLQFAIEGKADLNIDGLLNIVKSNQSTDSCRSYQCIKTLVNAANKSVAVKDKLLEDPDRWQWSVNWLKNKIGTIDSTSPSNQWLVANSPTSSDVLSNEDSTTRTFQRTTSAMLTLEDANAILAEFDRSSPICDEDMDTDNGNTADPFDDEMPDLTISGNTSTAKTD